MWDRLRSATGGGGGASGGLEQYQGRTTPLGRKDRASTFGNTTTTNYNYNYNYNNRNSNSNSNSSSSGNSTPSWQPRSSVIAAREGQGQGQQQQQQQQTRQTGPPPPRPPRDFQLQPPPSFEAAPSHHYQHQHQHQHQHQQQQRSHTLPPLTSHRDSVQGRPPSSVYSQPSPLVTDFGPRGPAQRYAMSPEEVSPPSSPEDTRAKGTVAPNHDISPIDEEDDFSPTRPRPLPDPPRKMAASPAAAHASLPSQQRRGSNQNTDNTTTKQPPAPAAAAARTNIPMMRRERRAQRDAAAAAAAGGGRNMMMATDKPRGQKDPRWDPMTGEITNSDKGRPSQVKPVEFARGLGISTMSSTSPPSPERERASSRSGSRAGQRSGGGGSGGGSGGGGGGGGSIISATDPAATAFGPGSSGPQRPGWKGASGRTAIVDPVKDTPEVAPLKIPPRSRRRETAGARPPPLPMEDEKQQQQQKQAPGNMMGSGSGGGVLDNDAMARLSPPISPETGPGNQGVGMGRGVVIGGGGSAGSQDKSQSHDTPNGNTNLVNLQAKGGGFSSTSTGRSLASTIRKIIPSASSTTGRLFSGGSSSRNSPAPTPDGSNSPVPNLNQKHGSGSTSHTTTTATRTAAEAEHGYPSPPLSGNAITAGGGGSSLVNAHAPDNNASNFGNANAAKIDNNLVHSDPDYDYTPTSSDFLVLPNSHHQHQQPHHQPPPPQQTPSIRRKEVAASFTSALTSTTSPTSKHNPHESFSSSVYSRPDDAQDDHSQPPLYARQPPSAHANRPLPPTAQLNNTKNLPNLPHGAAAANTANEPPYVQPSSRFSITTYATSHNTTTPRESFDVAPSLPTPPKDIVLGLNNNTYDQQYPQSDMPASSVLDRQRPQMRGGANKWEDPVDTTDEAPVKISLSKAWMSTAGANSSGKNQQASPSRTRQPKGPRNLAPSNNNNNKTSTTTAPGTNKENRGMFGFGFLGGGGPKSPTSDDSRPGSVMSNMDKDLPPAPAAAPVLSNLSSSLTTTTPAPTAANTTADRIAQLNALLQDLANRRLNIHRAIKQMTELMPQDNLIMQEAVRRKREDEKRKIEELKRRLDDIGREEHELGMKLHRAYKKLDRAAEYEPTTLWVRRATGS